MQYTALYCNLKGWARLDCIAIQCPAKPRYGQEARRQQALGRTGRVGRATGRRAGRRGRSLGAARRGRAGARGAQAGGRAGRPAGRSSRRGARGLGLPVRAGWACWLVSWAKLVHCAPGSVLTRYFPESLNEHCSL